VLLIDADTYGSSLAMRLGLLDDGPGLAAACRAAAQGSLDVATLARHSLVVTPGLRILTGLTRAARWPELPSSSLEVVLERARELAAWTVVDVAAPVEADEVLMYDTQAPQRNAATLAALAAADDVVVVGAADPIGIQRLVRALEDLRDAPVVVAAQTAVVVNRARASAVGARPEVAVREAMARYAGLDDIVVVPDDAAALDGATLAGKAVAELAPGSPALGAIATLADRLAVRAA
jgi:MinD-like ATPase involved in chromosome partitioning or flagellar assembly